MYPDSNLVSFSNAVALVRERRLRMNNPEIDGKVGELGSEKSWEENVPKRRE